MHVTIAVTLPGVPGEKTSMVPLLHHDKRDWRRVAIFKLIARLRSNQQNHCQPNTETCSQGEQVSLKSCQVFSCNAPSASSGFYIQIVSAKDNKTVLAAETQRVLEERRFKAGSPVLDGSRCIRAAGTSETGRLKCHPGTLESLPASALTAGKKRPTALSRAGARRSAPDGASAR